MNKTITGAKTLEDTKLWMALQEKDQQGMSALVGALPDLCEEAASRMKMVPVDFPLYTLHDETHLLRVVEIMGLILGDTIEQLNSLELALLILSAYMHDLGMVLDGGERGNLEKDPKFLNFRDEWRVQHGNYAEISAQKTDSSLSDTKIEELGRKLAELDRAMRTDYLRETHAIRSREYVVATFSTDRRMEFSGVNIAGFVGRLCESHGKPVRSLNESNGFRFDEEIGTQKVNLPYLAVLLRLADILDFDSDRTPDVLFRTIHFTNNVSLQEWEKHRGVKGWTISASLIRYTAQYDHPAYHAACLKFMDWIDDELSSCHALCRNFPSYVEKHRLNLPGKVERDRIAPKDGAYEYHALEISLSRDEIIKLLMADKLYNKPHYCVRELLQNSLDALRYRKTLYTAEGFELSDGKVVFLHSVDADGYEVLTCTDNGVGMELDVIQRFLTRAGRSYYRSPEYERQRIYFREKGVDFDPCSQFGIGFMSCFMLGDRIQIETRRDNGPQNNRGEPWVVEITGLGSIVVIKKGVAEQPIGTTVKITSRKKPGFLDHWKDQVKLLNVLKGYAIATEFPIYGHCEIPEMQGQIEIPTSLDAPPTLLEENGLEGIEVFEVSFDEIEPQLRGVVREAFLVTKDGVPTSKNEVGEWVYQKTGTSSKGWKLKHEKGEAEHRRIDDSQVSLDGILVCGEPGRPQWDYDSRGYLGMSASPVYGSPFLIDVRGELKPSITPARTPPDRFGGFSYDLSWRRLSDSIERGAARIWESVAVRHQNIADWQDFWRLCSIYKAPLLGVRKLALWESFRILESKDEETDSWKHLYELPRLALTIHEESPIFVTPSDTRLPGSVADATFQEKEKNCHISNTLTTLILSLCEVSLDDNSLSFKVVRPSSGEATVMDSVISGISLVPFSGKIDGFLSVECVRKIANRNHPICKITNSSKYKENVSPEVKFASSFLECVVDLISSPQSLDLYEMPNRWMKIVAHKYFDVDWTKIRGESLQPPYRFWTRDKGIFEITEEDLKIWRDAPIREEERSP